MERLQLLKLRVITHRLLDSYKTKEELREGVQELAELHERIFYGEA